MQAGCDTHHTAQASGRCCATSLLKQQAKNSQVGSEWQRQMFLLTGVSKGCAESGNSYFGYVIADQSSVTRTKIFLITSREDVHASRA
mgnify:CR=1 FL=1